MNRVAPTLLLLSLAALSPLAHAGPSVSGGPSTSALSIVGVGNSANNPNFVSSLDDHASGGSYVTASATKSFTGMDRTGQSRTMTFTGQTATESEFGRLRSYSSGSVTNSYYNASNPVYLRPDQSINPAGSPDNLVCLGFAWFNDTLQFGGALQAGYKARYIFHVDGTNTGIGDLADLSVTIANDAPENFFAADPGFISTNWATVDHDINGTTPQDINVQFSNQVVLNNFDLADGANASGVSDFSSTLTLAAIDVVDANGNPVSGVTVTSASGTVYPVPEPASFAALAGGVAVLARRRKRSA